MKNYILKSFLAAALFTGSLTSCSEDDDSSSVSNNTAQVNSIISTANSGIWKVHSFIDSGTDETNHFTNYNFDFGDNGVLTAVGANTYTGIWSVTSSNNSNDDDSPDSSSDIDFNIIFNSTAPADFIDLNDDWDVTSVTANEISLRDVSGGNGGTDILVFRRNN